MYNKHRLTLPANHPRQADFRSLGIQEIIRATDKTTGMQSYTTPTIGFILPSKHLKLHTTNSSNPRRP